MGEDGNPDWTALPATKMVVSLSTPTLLDGKGSRFSQSGTVFVPRGYDLKHGDRLPYDGVKYSVVGRPRGNHDHALTGEDFGWVAFTVTGGGG